MPVSSTYASLDTGLEKLLLGVYRSTGALLEQPDQFGLFGTRELAHDAQTRIAADIRAFASDPAIVEKLTATGQIVSPGNGAEFAASIEQQKAQVAAIAKLFGNKPVQ